MKNKVIDFNEAKQKILEKKENHSEEHLKMRELTNMLQEMGLNPKDAEKLYSELINYKVDDISMEEIQKLIFGDVPW